MLCRKLDLLAEALVAIDGSKFKAVNSRDKNFTRAKMERRLRDVEATIDRYLTGWTKPTDTSRRRITPSAQAKYRSSRRSSPA